MTDVLTGLVAVYEFEEATGTLARVDQVNGYDLAPSNLNGDPLSVSQAVGKVGNCVQASGSNQLRHAANADLNVGDDDLTIVIWPRIPTGSAASIQGIVGKYDSQNFAGEYNLEYNNDFGNDEIRFRWAQGETGAVDIETTGGVSKDTFLFIAARHDKTNNFIRLRKNTTDYGPQATAGVFPANHAGLLKVFYNGFTFAVSGTRADQLCIYKRHLSDADLDVLYNGGAGMSYADMLATAAPTESFDSVEVDDGLALVANGGVAHRVNFVGTGFQGGSPPDFSIGAGEGTLGLVTIDSDTTAHANYTPRTTAGTVTFTDATSGDAHSLTVLTKSTGYSVTGPSTVVTGVDSADYSVVVTPSGSAFETAVTVTPAIAPDGTIVGSVVLPARTVDAGDTFKVHPAADGDHTVSFTNDKSLPNQTDLAVTSASYNPGDPIDPNYDYTKATLRMVSGTELYGLHKGAIIAIELKGDDSVAVNVDTTEAHTNYPSPAGQWPSLSVSIDNGEGVSTSLASVNYAVVSGQHRRFSIAASGLDTDVWHRVLMWVDNIGINTLEWTTPEAPFRFLGLTQADGSALTETRKPRFWPCSDASGAPLGDLLGLWDSRGEDVLLDCTNGTPKVHSIVAQQLGLRPVLIARQGSGMRWQNPDPYGAPGWYDPDIAASQWDHYDASHSRLVSGAWPEASRTRAVIEFLGHNDFSHAIGTGEWQASKAGLLGDLRTALGPGIPILTVVDYCHHYYTQHVAAVAALADPDLYLYDLDDDIPGLSTIYVDNVNPSLLSPDGIHAKQGLNGMVATALTRKLKSILSPAVSGGGNGILVL